MRVNDRMNWLYKKCDYHDFVIHILHIKIIHFQCLFHSIVPSCNKFLDTASDTYHHMCLKLSSFSINIWSMPNFFARFTFLLIMAITFLCDYCCHCSFSFSSFVSGVLHGMLLKYEDDTQVWQFSPHGFTFTFLYHSDGSSLKGQSKFHLVMNCFY